MSFQIPRKRTRRPEVTLCLKSATNLELAPLTYLADAVDEAQPDPTLCLQSATVVDVLPADMGLTSLTVDMNSLLHVNNEECGSLSLATTPCQSHSISRNSTVAKSCPVVRHR